MKKQIFGAVVVVAVAVAAMINVNLNKVSNIGDLAFVNVEALAEDEGGGVTWVCSTYTSETIYNNAWCPEIQKDVKHTKTEVRNCNRGVLTWCYPGYLTTYYNCDGSQNKFVDDTDMSACPII